MAVILKNIELWESLTAKPHILKLLQRFLRHNSIEVTMLRETGRMLDWFGVRIRKAADGSEVVVECEASELDKKLLPETKITVLAYRTDKDEDGEPANRIVAKTLNY